MDEVRYPDGHTAVREVVEHPGGAVVVPVLADRSVLLIRQYRHPADGYVFELPAGKLEKGEPPEACARRELEEETGYTAPALIHLTSMFTTPGFCDEVLHIYLAEQCVPAAGGQDLDPGESLLTVHPATMNEVLGMIDRQEIRDGKTLAGLFLAFRKMGLSGGRR